jgi:sugar lactone lactonase YvrE
VCCGIVFDAEGMLYAGDRSGKIFKIDPAGACSEFASLEPSVSAYHLAIDKDRNLYVTGPTLSMRDSLYRISPDGQVDIVHTGFARPQGLALSRDGSLWITAAFAGQKGVFRVNVTTRELEHFLAAPTLVGLAFHGEDIFLADSGSLFWLKSPEASQSIF